MDRKNEFVRKLDYNLIDKLKKEKLFQENLLPDIKSGEVFPAIRNNRIDFYHKGGKLFSFDGKFYTHIKYASVFRLDNNKNYVTQDDLAEARLCDFIKDYKRIKENCSRFSGVEASGVSEIYSKYSYVNRGESSNVMVLDIEVSFQSLEDEREQDRIDIDLLLFNQKNGHLRFYEAKHFSNKEIWSKKGTEPKVVKQIKEYNQQIKRSEEIIKAYENYVNIVNGLFDLKLAEPEKVDPNVTLFIFGFDRDQLKGRFKKLLKDDNSLKDIKYYAIGDVSEIEIDTLWDEIK